jgi:hypothetical protein
MVGCGDRVRWAGRAWCGQRFEGGRAVAGAASASWRAVLHSAFARAGRAVNTPASHAAPPVAAVRAGRSRAAHSATARARNPATRDANRSAARTRSVSSASVADHRTTPPVPSPSKVPTLASVSARTSALLPGLPSAGVMAAGTAGASLASGLSRVSSMASIRAHPANAWCAVTVSARVLTSRTIGVPTDIPRSRRALWSTRSNTCAMDRTRGQRPSVPPVQVVVAVPCDTLPACHLRPSQPPCGTTRIRRGVRSATAGSRPLAGFREVSHPTLRRVVMRIDFGGP